MRAHVSLRELASSLALALRWQVSDLALEHDGCRVPLDLVLSQLEPPYEFTVVRADAPVKRKETRQRRPPAIFWDLGIIEDPQADVEPQPIGITEGASSSSSSSSSSLLLLPVFFWGARFWGASESGITHEIEHQIVWTPEYETLRMEEQDHTVACMSIKRPREELQHQFVAGATVDHLMTYWAHTRKMKKAGFAIYRELPADHILEEGGNYYLTWQRQHRGGSSITTTEPYDVSTLSATSNYLAQEHLRALEQFIGRMLLAQSYLRSFGSISTKVRVVSLAELSRDLAQSLRAGGGPNQKSEPTRWETHEGQPGLRLHSELMVGQEGARQTLKALTVDHFSNTATGYSLLAWSTWEEKRDVVSTRPLFAVLPGRRKEQVLAYKLHTSEDIIEIDAVMEQTMMKPGEPVKQFAKMITIVLHSKEEQYRKPILHHHARKIDIQPQNQFELLLDYYYDQAPQTQDWTSRGLKEVFQRALQTWKLDEGCTPQWPTLRNNHDVGRTTVVVRCGAPQREVILRKSGTCSVFSRERVEPSRSPYAVVWLLCAGEKGTPQGILSGHAETLAGHWGMCRNGKSYGLRAPKDQVDRFRKLLRPSDSAINEHNKSLFPQKLWVLKGVSAAATPAELAAAISKEWPILPIRQLASRKERAVWLVESEIEPPSRVLETSQSIIMIEEHETRKGPQTGEQNLDLNLS